MGRCKRLKNGSFVVYSFTPQKSKLYKIFFEERLEKIKKAGGWIPFVKSGEKIEGFEEWLKMRE